MTTKIMTMIETRNFELNNKAGYQIKGYIKYPAKKDNLPLVVIMHGFKAYKEWGFFPYISSKIASAGAIALCFDFSLNGISDGKSELFDVDMFSSNTISQELNDALAILGNVGNGKLLSNARIENCFSGDIYLLGHSLGGAIAILAAREIIDCNRLIESNKPLDSPIISENEAINSTSYAESSFNRTNFTLQVPIEKKINIKKVALWCTISHFDRYTKRQKAQWRRQGFMEFMNNSTGQLLKMNVSYLEDIERNALKFSLTKAVSELKFPVLILHGNKDVTVPIKEGRELAKNISKDFLKFIEIKNTGHIFGIEHPLINPTESLNKALDTTIEFFELK